MKNFSLFLGILFIFFPCLGNASVALSDLSVLTDDKIITYQVEIAQTPQEQETGLMNRKFLAENSGMLFIFSHPRPITMWMKNTKIPLDMIFTDKQGKILCIYENATPYSLKHITCEQKVAAVLELNGGEVQKRNILKGNYLSHKFFEKTKRLSDFH